MSPYFGGQQASDPLAFDGILQQLQSQGSRGGIGVSPLQQMLVGMRQPKPQQKSNPLGDIMDIAKIAMMFI